MHVNDSVVGQGLSMLIVAFVVIKMMRDEAKEKAKSAPLAESKIEHHEADASAKMFLMK